LHDHRRLHRHGATLASHGHPRRVGAEADELRVGAGARGEPLRRNVQRLEQVRLAGAVRTDDENQAAAELELQRLVRPEVSERE